MEISKELYKKYDLERYGYSSWEYLIISKKQGNQL